MIVLNRRTLSILLVILLLSTSGCWSRREIQTLTINSAIGIDRIITNGRPKILLSVLTLRPTRAAGVRSGGNTGQSPETSPGQVISVTGETIQDAVRNWNMRSSRQLFMAHTVLIVIGETVAREGIGRVIDFGNRNRDIPKRAMVVVCQGQARDCLQAIPEFEPLLATEAYNILNLNKLFTSKTRGRNLLQVMYDLMTPGIETTLASLKTFTPPEKGSVVRQDAPGGEKESGNGNQPQQKIFTVTGIVAFRGEKLAGRLNEVETQGLMFIRDEAQGGIIPLAFNSTQDNASYLFRDVRTKVKPIVKRTGIAFQVKIKGTGELIATAPETVDITKRGDVKKMEALINREVERRCRNAVARAKGLRSDVFGFGDKLHRTHPQVWRKIENRWEETFPYVNVDIQADFSLEHSGLLTRSLKIR
ncbi:MAG: spore germination protein [Clostridia bacterium]|nr:spore germination protein [Clostridia bacterium]